MSTIQNLVFLSNLKKSFSNNGVYVDDYQNRKLGRVGQPYPKGKGKSKSSKGSFDVDGFLDDLDDFLHKPYYKNENKTWKLADNPKEELYGTARSHYYKASIGDKTIYALRNGRGGAFFYTSIKDAKNPEYAKNEMNREQFKKYIINKFGLGVGKNIYKIDSQGEGSIETRTGLKMQIHLGALEHRYKAIKFADKFISSLDKKIDSICSDSKDFKNNKIFMSSVKNSYYLSAERDGIYCEPKESIYEYAEKQGMDEKTLDTYLEKYDSKIDNAAEELANVYSQKIESCIGNYDKEGFKPKDVSVEGYKNYLNK